MWRIAITMLILCCISTGLQAQNGDQQKTEDIRRILELQKSEVMWDLIIDKMMVLLKVSEPYRSELYWQRYKKVIESNYPQFVDAAIKSNAKHLTKEEAAALLEFSTSELGASIMAKNPIIMMDLMNSGEVIGANIYNDVLTEQKSILSTVYTGCSEFKTGEFYYIPSSGDSVKIERTAEYQIEYYQGTITKHRLEWLDDCKYRLVTIESSNENMQDDLGDFLVNIYEQSSSSYRYVTKAEKYQDVYYEGEIFMVE